MHPVDILITSELDGGTQPFRHGDLHIVFHKWGATGEVPLTEGTLWAFVDWDLADPSAVEICRRLRCEPLTAHAHITMVVEDDPQLKRQAISIGADDYIVAPVDRRKLLDRVLAFNLLTTANSHRRTIELSDLSVDLTAFQARWKNQPIPLRPTEFRLLRYLVEHPGRVFTRLQLIAALGKQDPPIDERTVDVWIGRLRRALRAAGAEPQLRTVRQLGYVLDKP